jgi:hypothetical protein
MSSMAMIPLTILSLDTDETVGNLSIEFSVALLRLVPNLVSFNRAVVPYEISKVNFRVETNILVSISEEI